MSSIVEKPRLTALDGLRGFAALAVSLSHIGFNIGAILPFTAAIAAYRTLAVGPNSVQIFFVLSGFLIAFLYPTVKNPVSFIQKRYARILPILAIVIFYLSCIQYFDYKLAWYIEATILIVSALVLNRLWIWLSTLENSTIIVRRIFFIFIGVQLLTLIFNLVIAPRIMTMPFYDTSIFETLHIWFTNTMLTTPFIRGVDSLSSVLWSLPPEMYFYLLYPIISIFILNTVKKYPWYVGALVAIAAIKILFDLDEILRGVLNMRTMNISRTSGFIIGMIVGQIALNTPPIIKKIFSHWAVNIFLLGLLILIQVGDWTIRDGQTIWFMNVYYLGSSIVVGCVVLAAVIRKSIIERIFSNKILVFYGMISYSLYLTHINVSRWIHPILQPLEVLPTAVFSVIQLIGILIINIAVSYCLYQLVEALYLKRKKDTVQTVKKVIAQQNNYGYVILPIVFFIFIIISYTGMVRPTQYSANHSYYSWLDIRSYKDNKISLLEKPVIRIPLEAYHDNFSVIILNLWYFKNAEITRNKYKVPATLRFRLIDPQQNKVLSETWWKAYDIESESNYPFAFPTIGNSKGKTYIVELYLKGGSKEDYVIFNAAPSKMISIYTDTFSNIISHPWKPLTTRLTFILTHQDSIFLIICLIGFSYLYYRKREEKII